MPKRSILIIDDDPEAIRSFGPALRSCGYDAHAALNADSAIAAIEQTVPDAILLDLHLPVTDGVQLLRRLRGVSRLAAIPVAVVTGDYLVDDAVSNELLRLGAELHYKPLWEEDVLEIVANLLSSARSDAAAAALANR